MIFNQYLTNQTKTMKTLNEIFATNPGLLNEPEVKELVDQFTILFKANKLKYENYWNRITDLTMNSEFFLIKGMPCAKVVEEIHNLSFDN